MHMIARSLLASQNDSKIGPVVQEARQFRNYLPLEKGETLHLNKLESPSPRMFC